MRFHRRRLSRRPDCVWLSSPPAPGATNKCAVKIVVREGILQFSAEAPSRTVQNDSLLNVFFFFFFKRNNERRQTARSRSHSLVAQNVSVLVGVEGQLEDAVHDAALDGHLGVLQLLLAGVLPNGVAGHGAVQVAQEVLHRRRLVVRRRAALERWWGRSRESVRLSRRDGYFTLCI